MKPFRNGIFISYSHRDKPWLDKIVTGLKPLTRGEKIEVWDDTKIAIGSKWNAAITEAIQSARIAVLLVTPDFLASDFIYKSELPLIEEESKKGELIIYWIAVSYSSYELTSLAQLQAANDPQKPLDSLNPSEQNKTIADIAKKIAAAMDVNMVSNTLSIIDAFVPRQKAFVANQPFETGPQDFRVQASQANDKINFSNRDQVMVEQITAEDLKKLDPNARQLLSSFEITMKELFDRWTELQPKTFSVNPIIRENSRDEMALIRKDLCGQLTMILNFLSSIGKNLQDHYHHVRFICDQAAVST